MQALVSRFEPDSSGTGNLGQVGKTPQCFLSPGVRPFQLSIFLLHLPHTEAATLAVSTLTPTPWDELSEILLR